jgi:hypothetical protein
MSTNTYNGSCACEAVKFTITGPFLFSGICHCQQCRDAIGQPFAFVCGVKEDNFKVTDGSDLLSDYKVTDTATRKFCNKCGTTVQKKRESHIVA